MLLKITLSTVTGGILATLLVWLANGWAGIYPMGIVPPFASLGSNLLQAFLLSMLFQRWLDAWGFLRGAWHGGWIAGLFAGAFYLRCQPLDHTVVIHLTIIQTFLWSVTGGVMGLMLQKMRGHPVFKW